MNITNITNTTNTTNISNTTNKFNITFIGLLTTIIVLICSPFLYYLFIFIIKWYIKYIRIDTNTNNNNTKLKYFYDIAFGSVQSPKMIKKIIIEN